MESFGIPYTDIILLGVFMKKKCINLFFVLILIIAILGVSFVKAETHIVSVPKLCELIETEAENENSILYNVSIVGPFFSGSEWHIGAVCPDKLSIDLVVSDNTSEAYLISGRIMVKKEYSAIFEEVQKLVCTFSQKAEIEVNDTHAFRTYVSCFEDSYSKDYLSAIIFYNETYAYYDKAEKTTYYSSEDDKEGYDYYVFPYVKGFMKGTFIPYGQTESLSLETLINEYFPEIDIAEIENYRCDSDGLPSDQKWRPIYMLNYQNRFDVYIHYDVKENGISLITVLPKEDNGRATLEQFLSFAFTIMNVPKREEIKNLLLYLDGEEFSWTNVLRRCDVPRNNIGPPFFYMDGWGCSIRWLSESGLPVFDFEPMTLETEYYLETWN